LPLYPHYQPHFSSEEVSLAEQTIRKHKAGQTEVKRAHLLLLLADNPKLSSPECATAIDWHEQTVRKWRKRWSIEAVTLTDKPRSGRREAFSPSAKDSNQSHCL